nr:hypothetical protein [Tanacetum cinerariifolium]
MSKDPFIPRRNKVNWHYVRDDHMFTTFKLVSKHQNTQQFGALLPIELTHEDIRNSNAYKEYYVVATGATPPKPKASDDGEEGNDDDDAQDDDDQEDEGNDKDDEKEGSADEQASDEEEFIHPSLSTHAEEKTRDEESFDPISKTPKNTDDECNGEENLGMNVGREEGQDEEDEEGELYRDQSSSVSSQFVTSMLNPTPDVGMESIFETTSQMDVQSPTSMAPLLMSAPTLTRSTIATITTTQQTSYAVVADLSEMELKKILIEKIEGNKSIHRSNEQRNLYKALVKSYESDKIILDTYEDTVMLKRRRDDDANKDQEPSAGLDRGSKRRKEGKEPESASAPQDKATRSAGKSTQGILNGFLNKKPPTPDCDWNKTLPATHGSIQPWISDLAKLIDSRSSFNELMDTLVDFSNFLMNRLKVDTLTPELLADPTYELMNGSCKSLVELQFFLEKVYKATTDQLDWVNPEGKLTNLIVEERFAFNVSLRMFTRSIVIQRRVEDLQLGVESYQKKLNLTKPDTYRSNLKRKEAYIAYSNPRGFIYQNKDKQSRLMRIDGLHKFSDGTLTNVHTALDDHLKGILMKYLPQSIWRKSDKDRAAAMIQAIDKMLKTRRIMRSLGRFVGGRLYEGDFRMLQRTI